MPTRQSLRCSAVGRDRPTPDVRAALHDPDSLFGEASEKLTQRKEVNQAADHDGRQPRQHNVRIR